MISIQICQSRSLVCVIAMLLAGCDLPERPPLQEVRSDSSVRLQGADRESQVALEAPGTPFEGAWETWDAYFVKERQVGYAHIQAHNSSVTDAQSDVRYLLESRLYLNQGPARLLQRISQISTETYEGRLVSFEGEVRVGPATTRFNGAVSQGELKVETVRGVSRTTRSIPWNPTYRGLVALEQSLRQRPMQTKGEERTLKMLLPGRYELATARMRCLGLASVPLLDGELHELFEINCEIQSEDETPSFSTIWTDSKGDIARTHSPALQLIAYRTDQKTATGFAGNDQVIASLPVAGELRSPQAATRVGYKIRATAAAIRANVQVEVKPAPGQYVRRLEDNVFQVLVSRREETSGRGFIATHLEPTELDTAPNAILDFMHQDLQRFLTLVIQGDQLTDREVAMELTRSVHQNIPVRPDMNGFSRASSVAKNWTADPTERAIFLTALLRGRRIPARLVMGLKYVPGTPARLVYHPWSIAFVEGNWIHLDPSEGGLAAADRLVFSTTDLSSGDEFETISPLLETMRAIRVEIVGQN